MSSSSQGSKFSLYSVVLDIVFYSFYFLSSLFPFPQNLQRRKERAHENLAIKEKLLSVVARPINTPSAPAISIVIPSYNEENHLERTLQAALATDTNKDSSASVTSPLPSVEIIVSDGGSKDDTEGVCLKYADRGVRFITGGSCRAQCQNIGALSSQCSL